MASGRGAGAAGMLGGGKAAAWRESEEEETEADGLSEEVERFSQAHDRRHSDPNSSWSIRALQ